MKKTLRKMISATLAMMTILTSMMILVNTTATPAEAFAAENETSEYSDLIEEMAVKFNSAREELGLDPLYIVPCLNEISQIRAEEQLTKYDHYRPDGTFFDSVIDVEKVDYKKAGEILARGSKDADIIFDAWKRSPAHWANITKPEFTHVGLSLTYGMDSDGRETWYWAVIFVGMWEKTDTLEDQRMPEIIETLNADNGIIPACAGNVNGDSMIDAFDLVMIARYLDGSVEFNNAQLKAADAFNDGKINEADILVLRRYILGQYSTLPVTI